MVPVEELDDYRAKPRSRGFVVAGLLIAVAAFAYVATRPPPSIRQSVPDFELPLLAGGTISSEELRGRPVVLNFWASWCAPCREEMPLFEEIAAEFADEGLVVLAVNVRDLEPDAVEFVDDLDLSLTTARDPGNRLAESLEVFGLPQTFFITSEWEFLAVERGLQIIGGGPNQVLGAISEDVLRARVAELLRGS